SHLRVFNVRHFWRHTPSSRTFCLYPHIVKITGAATLRASHISSLVASTASEHSDPNGLTVGSVNPSCISITNNTGFTPRLSDPSKPLSSLAVSTKTLVITLYPGRVSLYLLTFWNTTRSDHSNRQANYCDSYLYDYTY